MGIGIEVRTNDNNLIIDSTYRNLWLSRKIQITAAGTTTGTFSDDECLAAVGGVTGDIDAYCENTPTGWTCIVKTYKAGLYVYVFSKNPFVSEHGSGLQVFDKSGNCVFDSNKKYAKVVAFGTAPNTYSISESTKKLAIALGAPKDYKLYREERTATMFQGIEWVPAETEKIFHPAEWGWYTDSSGKQVYGVIKDSYWETKTIKEGYYANTYTVTYRTRYYNIEEKYNYKIVGNTVSSNVRESDHSTYYSWTETGESYSTKTWSAAIAMAQVEAWSYNKHTSNASYVDCQSFLLLDVTGL